MGTIDINSTADIYFQLKWNSDHATHMEGFAARDVNLWRDWLPEPVRTELIGKAAWEKAKIALQAGELFGQNKSLLKIDRQQIRLMARSGRFYPKGRLNGLNGIFPQNMQPFRCVGFNNGHLLADMGHPLSAHPLELSLTVGQVADKQDERGGSSADWVGQVTDGPGMQARWQDKPTDFFSDKPFVRRDEQSDHQFYAAPRLVHHIDRTAREILADIHKRFVSNDMHVLDLMTSWQSHLPEEIRPATLSGLGLNQIEMEANGRLTEFLVHDLNADPTLPYANQRFDVVLCSLSIEYLTRPLAVFTEVARVLRPGGVFVVSFSNRWFPTKAIHIWEEIHEFERLGLVMEYFLQNGAFENLGTSSMRGLPRPAGDKYASEQAFSDPAYAVWGVRKALDGR